MRNNRCVRYQVRALTRSALFSRETVNTDNSTIIIQVYAALDRAAYSVIQFLLTHDAATLAVTSASWFSIRVSGSR